MELFRSFYVWSTFSLVMCTYIQSNDIEYDSDKQTYIVVATKSTHISLTRILADHAPERSLATESNNFAWDILGYGKL